MLRRVAFVRTDVSEEPGASFIRVTRIGELGTTQAATSKQRTLCNIPEDTILHSCHPVSTVINISIIQPLFHLSPFLKMTLLNTLHKIKILLSFRSSVLNNFLYCHYITNHILSPLPVTCPRKGICIKIISICLWSNVAYSDWSLVVTCGLDSMLHYIVSHYSQVVVGTILSSASVLCKRMVLGTISCSIRMYSE
jgi:hypothetical protein